MSFNDLLSTWNPWWRRSGERLAPQHPRREAFEPVRRRLVDPETARAQVVVGMRRVGKSVLLKQIAGAFLDEHWPPSNVTYFDFRDDRYDGTSELRHVVDARPPGFREDRPRLILLDEVTNAPRWDLGLKRIVDEARSTPPDRRARVLVTDSAAALVRSGARESLEGRIDEHPLHPLTFREALHFQGTPEESKRDVLARSSGACRRFLESGGLPEHVANRDLDLAWERIRSDVTDRAIARDLSREGLDIQRATALFRVLIQGSGNVFDASSRAHDMSEDRSTDARTIRRWVELFEQACLIGRLAPWHPGARTGATRPARALKARSKVYAEDHGFIPAFSPFPTPMANGDVVARVYETAVFTHLRELRDRRKDFALGFCREDEELEVDFILDFGDRAIGVEVTSSKAPEKRSGKLARLGSRIGLGHLILVHGGLSAPMDAEPVSHCPLDAFLFEPNDYVERSLHWARASR